MALTLTNAVKKRLRERNLLHVVDLLERKEVNDDDIETWDDEKRDEKLSEMGIDAKEDRCVVLEIRDRIVELCKSKIFQDPLHGAMELHPLLVKIIDTPQFQRLRDIKQLGGVYHVFPGASHNRFEHSIGVCYLAGEFIEHLRKKQPGLDISEQDILCVKIAGLCHDMGHGPYSHLFQDLFLHEVRPRLKWKHETASIKLLQHLVEKNALCAELMEIYGLDWERDSPFIFDLITGKKDNFKKKAFLYEIVANSISGVDVDKMDYIIRDCHGLGIKMAFDWKRYMLCCRVIQAGEDKQYHICPREKEVASLYELFYMRDHLYRAAYQHKTKRAVEFMLNDALIKADPVLRIPGKDGQKVKVSEAIEDMDAFTLLTDSVFHQIRMSFDPDLEESRKLLERVEKRELYTYINYFLLKKFKTKSPVESATSPQFSDQSTDDDLSGDQPLPQSQVQPYNDGTTYNDGTSDFWHDSSGMVAKIAEIASDGNDEVTYQEVMDAIKIDLVKFNFGKNEGKDNPIEKIFFYRKNSSGKAVPITGNQTPGMFFPRAFEQFECRLYSKSKDERIVKALIGALVLFCENEGYERPPGEDVTDYRLKENFKN